MSAKGKAQEVDRESYKKVFDTIDADGTGKIDKKELANLLKAAIEGIDEAEAQEYAAALLADDADGQWTFDEFMAKIAE